MSISIGHLHALAHDCKVEQLGKGEIWGAGTWGEEGERGEKGKRGKGGGEGKGKKKGGAVQHLMLVKLSNSSNAASMGQHQRKYQQYNTCK